MGSKQRIWDADFEAVENVANRIMRKKLSAKKWQKNGVFLLLLLCAKICRL